jgi:hypothetical protein
MRIKRIMRIKRFFSPSFSFSSLSPVPGVVMASPLGIVGTLDDMAPCPTIHATRLPSALLVE